MGKNEASRSSNKSSAIMIVSIIAVTLFIGTSLQPAIASPIPEVEEREEECLLCRSRERPAETKPKCKSCLCTAYVAVGHGIGYTKDKIIEQVEQNNGEVYDGIFGDIVLWLVEGIAEGIVVSGFKLEFDKEELKGIIKDYVDKHIGPQGHDITKILIALQAISIGIRIYLISLCADGRHILPITASIMKFLSKVLSEFLIKILLLKV